MQVMRLKWDLNADQPLLTEKDKVMDMVIFGYSRINLASIFVFFFRI